MPFPRPARVLCAGNISYDILMGPVETFAWGRSNWADDFREDMGGNGSNTAYAMARLGLPVRLIGKVGRDARGDALLEKLRSSGADCSLVGRSEASTTTTVVLRNRAGDRQFVQHLGASREVFTEPLEFTPALLAGATHYHQANVFSLPNLRRHAAEILRRARAAGLATSLDTGWATSGEWEEVLRPALPHCDLFLTNEDEGRAATGESLPARMAARFREWGAGDLIIKLGPRGCAVFEADREIHVPGFRVSAIDTTGAGDCFAGGLYAALFRGYPLPDAARIANAVGAMNAARVGATTGVADWDRTLAWMAQAEESSPT
jgi:sugar/nucleoside kinase (ribokinase family)